MGTDKPKFIAFELKGKTRRRWGVLNRQTGELVERATAIEKYPEAWARNRADQLNEKEKNK
jgi:hypothetical protein